MNYGALSSGGAPIIRGLFKCCIVISVEVLPVELLLDLHVFLRVSLGLLTFEGWVALRRSGVLQRSRLVIN